MKILKMRGTHHGEGVYPYIFVRNVGVIVRASGTELSIAGETKSHDAVFEKAMKSAEFAKAPAHVLARLKGMQANWDYSYSPEEALQIMFESYGLK